MQSCYLETRRTHPDHQAADIAQHWQMRRKLGPALVVCKDPRTMQQQLTQYWQRLTRHLQTKRNKTMETDQLLRLTHQISDMQKVRVGASNKRMHTNINCVSPSELDQLADANYYSVYIASDLEARQVEELARLLPHQCLVVCYAPFGQNLQSLSLHPRAELDQLLNEQWQTIQNFLQTQHIDIVKLSKPSEDRLHYINEALDALLGRASGQRLLQLASEFKNFRQLAQPSSESTAQNRLYDTLIVLARHVQAWSPSAFGQMFHAGIDDPMFFNDSSRVIAEQLFAAYNELDQMDANAQWNNAEPSVA